MEHDSHVEEPDVVLVGSGVMSAHVGALLRVLDPSLSVQLYEATAGLARESSHGWNNAGTGHAGLCELSYTPNVAADGSVDVSNAIKIYEQFEHSRQFWAHALTTKMVDGPPGAFVNRVPHVSFVHGAEMAGFLRARHEALAKHHFFESMAFTTDRATIARWAPLLIEGRDPSVPVAATRAEAGTDVNFGELSRRLVAWLARQPRCGVATEHRVVGLRRRGDGRWDVRVRNGRDGKVRRTSARFVFVGAGGGSLPLLQMSGIPEARGLGGFPIGGQWLVCDDPAIVERHHAKVYGQPQPEAPTMAVPHLDSRVLDGKRALLFGPFAAWTTRFLHGTGRLTDLPKSVRPHNLMTLLNIGVSNLGLVRYLVQQGTQRMSTRMNVLRRFYPAARDADWRLVDAGIRVQAIKRSDGKAGIVHYGTEVIASADGSIAALLGASPGASIAADVALGVIRRCMPEVMGSGEGAARLAEAVPSYGANLADPANAERFRALSARASALLGLAS